MPPTRELSTSTIGSLPTREEIAQEWRRRAKRPGLARVMRASQPEALAAEVTETTRRLVAEQLDAVAARLDRPLHSALEVGCGIGRLTPTIAARAERVVAIDMTTAMLDAAARACTGLANVEFRHCPARQLPIGQSRVDVAVCVWVLMHVLDDLELAAICRRLARAANHLVIVEYEHAAIPVGEYSRLRDLDDYLALLPQSTLLGRQELRYGGDRSFAALIALNREPAW